MLYKNWMLSCYLELHFRSFIIGDSARSGWWYYVWGATLYKNCNILKPD